MPRDSNGTYSLPAGNPVVTQTVIESAWANTTMSDIGTALTDSLDRAGSGPMTGQLKLANGAIGAPALSWGTEPTSGLYRNAAGDHRYSISSNDVLQLSAAVTRVFSTQLQVANGSVGTPAIAYASETNGGWYRNGAGDHRYAIGAADVLQIVAGAFRTPDGTVGAPGWSFVSDTDLGWRRAGANDMRGVANGADVLAVTTAGIAVTGAATVSTTLGVTGAATFTADSGNARSDSGATVDFRVENTSNTASSIARLTTKVAGSSAGDALVNFEISGVQQFSAGIDNSDSDTFKVQAGSSLSGTAGLTITTGNIVNVDGRRVGYRGLNSNSQAAGYTFVADDAGRGVGATSAGNFTINTGVFAADDIFTFINTTGANCTIVQGAGVTLRLMGSSGTTGSRTVANHGVATIISQNGAVFLVGGPGVT